MTTHEMILSCPSFSGVGSCIALCLVLSFATFSASPLDYGLKHAAACRSTAHVSWGPLVLELWLWLWL